jgi:hypothetical protein
MGFPKIPERLRAYFDSNVPGFWSWWQSAQWYLDRYENSYLNGGTPGPQGPQGLQGPRGLKGETGAAGADGQFPVGSVIYTSENVNPEFVGVVGTWEQY